MCKIAWSNGAYVATQPAQEPVECLDCGSNNVGIPATYDSLVNSVKSQPAQEPVAHLWECLGRWSAYLVCNGKQAECAPPSWLVEAIQNAITPPKREWVKLKPDEINAVDKGFTSSSSFYAGALWAQAKLKEKNA
jgi:hypothetical protein